ESGPPGYTASAWVCTGGGTQSGSNITLANGEDVTCTISNNDNGPTLTLVKVVTNDNGGTATPAQFTLTAAGAGGISGTGPQVGPRGGQGNVAYALSETGPPGYTASAWVCTGGGSQSGSNITLGLGDNVTCTISNNDIAPTLTLVKVVTKDKGGTAHPAEFHSTRGGRR